MKITWYCENNTTAPHECHVESDDKRRHIAYACKEDGKDTWCLSVDGSEGVWYVYKDDILPLIRKIVSEEILSWVTLNQQLTEVIQEVTEVRELFDVDTIR